MTDVLLVFPPVGMPDFNVTSPPLSVAYIGAALRNVGYKVKVLDMAIEGRNTNDLLQLVKEEDPKVVGFSSNIATHNNCLRLASLLKQYRPELKIIVGGVQASFLPNETLREGSVDALVMFEGELTTVEVVNHFIQGSPSKMEEIKGLAFLDNGELKINERRPFITDIDQLEPPARELLELDAYPFSGTIITSRGCPGRCTFCANGAFWHRVYRFYSVARVMQEIEELVGKYRIKYIFIVDDTFIQSYERVARICDEIFRRGIDIRWTCSARGKVIPEDLLEKMKKAGCRRIVIGAESGDNEILKSIKKDLTVEEIEDAVMAIRRKGIAVTCSFILGHLHDTHETIRKTLGTGKKLCGNIAGIDEDLSFAEYIPLTPVPGTEVFESLSDSKYKLYVDSWNAFTFRDPIVETPNLNRKELRKFYFESLDKEVVHMIVGAKREEDQSNITSTVRDKASSEKEKLNEINDPEFLRRTPYRRTPNWTYEKNTQGVDTVVIYVIERDELISKTIPFLQDIDNKKSIGFKKAEVEETRLVLNKTASMIWEMCDGSTPVSKIVKELASVFMGIEVSVLKKDVRDFLTKMARQNLLDLNWRSLK